MKRKIFSLLVTMLFAGFLANAQKPQVSVRFSNPQYDCAGQTYCLDVEFTSDLPGQQLFEMNLRFYYDDNILEYLGSGEFEPGYGMTEVLPTTTGTGSIFGLAGPADWVNEKVGLLNQDIVTILPTNGWLKLFKVCFHVDDPNSQNFANFCPSIIWDLQENWLVDEGGGFQPGDDGVVITVVDPSPLEDSSSTTEIVVQFNWEYGGNPNGVGFPVSEVCISTICGYIIPVSNWALFLGIGLMVLASLFIYRRRMS